MENKFSMKNILVGNTILLVIIIFILLFYKNCCNEPNTVSSQETEPEAPVLNSDNLSIDCKPPLPLNLMLVLDLSDRLLPEKNQVGRDTTIVHKIVELFEQKLRDSLYMDSKDFFQTIIADQVGGALNSNYNLAYNPSTKSPYERSKPNFDKWKVKYSTQMRNIYQTALQGKTKKEDFAGADIWRCFDQDLSKMHKKCYNNVVIILTDGYLDFEKDYLKTHTQRSGNKATHSLFLDEVRNCGKTAAWQKCWKNGNYGLLELQNPHFMNDTKVLLLEISPKIPDVSEMYMLEFMWREWTEGMGGKYRGVKKGQMNSVDDQLKNFISN